MIRISLVATLLAAGLMAACVPTQTTQSGTADGPPRVIGGCVDGQGALQSGTLLCPGY